MKRNHYAGTYLRQYEDTDIIITGVTDHGDCRTFDLSDGTHWLSDYNDTYEVKQSLNELEIGWDDTHGWIIVNEDGSITQIDWC